MAHRGADGAFGDLAERRAKVVWCAWLGFACLRHVCVCRWTPSTTPPSSSPSAHGSMPRLVRRVLHAVVAAVTSLCAGVLIGPDFKGELKSGVILCKCDTPPH